MPGADASTCAATVAVFASTAAQQRVGAGLAELWCPLPFLHVGCCCRARLTARSNPDVFAVARQES
jgi:hypothetical protein